MVLRLSARRPAPGSIFDVATERSQYVAAVERPPNPVDRGMGLTSARGFVMTVPGFSRVAGTIARFRGQSQGQSLSHNSLLAVYLLGR